MWINLLVIWALLAPVVQGALQLVTITAYYPKKLDFALRGSGCGLNWDKGVSMERAEAGLNSTGYAYTYTVKCDLSSENNLEVKALVSDKTWMIGTNHHIKLTPETMKSAFYPWFYSTKGSTEITTRVYSPELKNYRDVIVYMPPSYLENPLKVHHNVLIMHDGQNLFDPRTSAFGTAWMAQDTVDSLVVMGEFEFVRKF